MVLFLHLSCKKLYVSKIHSYPNTQIYKPKTKISNKAKPLKTETEKFCKMKNLRKPKPYSTSLKKPKPENFETEPALIYNQLQNTFSVGRYAPMTIMYRSYIIKNANTAETTA